MNFGACCIEAIGEPYCRRIGVYNDGFRRQLGER